MTGQLWERTAEGRVPRRGREEVAEEGALPPTPRDGAAGVTERQQPARLGGASASVSQPERSPVSHMFDGKCFLTKTRRAKREVSAG